MKYIQANRKYIHGKKNCSEYIEEAFSKNHFISFSELHIEYMELGVTDKE